MQLDAVLGRRVGCPQLDRVQVAGEKFDLIAYQRFEGLADVEVEMAGVVAFDLAAGCGARVTQGLARWRDGVGAADAEKDGEVDFLCRTPGPVGHDGRSHPRCHLVPECRVGRQ